jgi:alcohol dehydrogenase class IV
MVEPFQFSRLPRIWFGMDKIKILPGLIKEYGNSVLLLTGERSFASSGIEADLIGSIKNMGIKVSKETISGEPSPSVVDDIAARFRNEPPDVVAAVGGGSVMDAGKAISAMIPVKDTIRSFLEGIGQSDHPGSKIPFIAVPTTSGTGSEATKNAVISDVGKNGFKRSLRHDNFIPEIAIIDPGLTISCPPRLTAASGMDCFTQLVEAFVSVKASEFTNALALKGIRAASQSLVSAYRDGSDTGARSSMSFASLTSGICLANAGLGTVHGFASSIGGRFEIPHGIICGTLMAVTNEINVRKLIKGEGDSFYLHKYAVLGEMLIGESGKSDGYYTEWFIDHLHHLTYDLKLPGLKEAGMTESSIEEICSDTENKNNPVKLTKEEMIEILSRRFN